MSKNDDKENFVTILGVVLAGVIQISSSSGPFGFWNIIFGIVLCLVLSTYPLPTKTSKREHTALATTWGFIVMSGSGFISQELYRWANNTWWQSLPDFDLDTKEAPGGYYFILWLIFSTIAWFVIKFLIKKKIRAKQSTPAALLHRDVE